MRWRGVGARSLFSGGGGFSGELAATEQLMVILHTVPEFESPLDRLVSSLSPHSVSFAISELPFPLAFRFFAWASRHPSLRSWASHNAIVGVLRDRKPGSFDCAWRTLRVMEVSGLPVAPHAFVVLMSAYAASGMVEEAIGAFGRMPEFGSRPNTFTYNTLFSILTKKDGISLAMAVYNNMLKSGCRPNRSTYNILVHGLCKSGDMDAALRLFDEMPQLPGIMNNTVLLSSYFNAGRIDEAMGLFESMKTKNCRMDSAFHNAFLSGLCKSGRIDEAFEHLRTLRGDGFVLGLNGYSSLIDGLFKAGRFDEACWHYMDVLKKNLVPDCILYTIMIKGYSEAGKVEEAFTILRKMTDSGFVPDTFCYNTLIKGLCDKGFLDRARSLKLEISRKGRFADSATFTIMICGLCKEGLVHEARQIFVEMAMHGCERSVKTFNSLIHGLCKAGDLKEAEMLSRQMEITGNRNILLRLCQGPSRVHDNNILRKRIRELCDSGRVLEAYKHLQGVKDRVAPDIFTYNILINGFCKSGNYVRAFNYFRYLQKERDNNLPQPNEVTYVTLIDGLYRAHRREIVNMILKQMPIRGCFHSLAICNTIMRNLCNKRKVVRAVAFWLEHVESGGDPSKAESIRAACDVLERGELEEAVQILLDMDMSCGSLSSSPYTIWIIGLLQVRKVEEAMAIFRKLMKFNVDTTPATCALLIHSLCREERLHHAVDVMLYALGRNFKLNKPVVNRLIKRLCLCGRNDLALELANRLRHADYDLDCHLRLPTKELLYGDLQQINGDVSVA